MSSVSSLALPVRPVSPFPPHGVAYADQKPLDQWLADLSGFFLGLGTDRGLLVAETLQELTCEVRCCTSPGRTIDVETFRDRREQLADEADGWPEPLSWVDQIRYTVASPGDDR